MGGESRYFSLKTAWPGNGANHVSIKKDVTQHYVFLGKFFFSLLMHCTRAECEQRRFLRLVFNVAQIFLQFLANFSPEVSRPSEFVFNNRNMANHLGIIQVLSNKNNLKNLTFTSPVAVITCFPFPFSVVNSEKLVMKPGKEDAKIYFLMPTPVNNLSFCASTLCLNYHLLPIAQFRYIKIQPKTTDFSTTLR